LNEKGRRKGQLLTCVVAGLAALGLAGPARGEIVVLQPGAEGVDVAPYQFLPASARGLGEALWAFTDPEEAHSFRSFLRFDLPPDLLGPDEQIGSALLALFFDRDVGFGMFAGDDPGILECRPVLTAWNEMAVTWIAQPAFGDPVDVVDGITEFGDVVCDVTELVADWDTGLVPNHGIAVTNPTGRLIGFPSFEAKVDGQPDPLRPRLLINVVPEPEATAGTATAGTALAFLARRRLRARLGPSSR
jgi:hypothetical protein